MPHFIKKRLALLPLLAVLVSLFSFPAQASSYPTPEEVRDHLQGKRILFLGDSYTSTRGLDDYWDSWSGRLQTDFGMEVVCRSINGSTVTMSPFWGFAPGCCWFPICFRPIPEEETYDFVLVTCGSNDWDQDLPIGSDPESRRPWCFMGAMNLLIDRIQEAHPESILIFMTPWVSDGSKNYHGYTTNDYAYAMEYVCELRGVYCMNVSFPWVSGIFADNPEFREKYFISPTDPWHLNEWGHARFLPLAALWLDEICRYDAQWKWKQQLSGTHTSRGDMLPQVQ